MPIARFSELQVLLMVDDKSQSKIQVWEAHTQ